MSRLVKDIARNVFKDFEMLQLEAAPSVASWTHYKVVILHKPTNIKHSFLIPKDIYMLCRESATKGQFIRYVEGLFRKAIEKQE